MECPYCGEELMEIGVYMLDNIEEYSNMGNRGTLFHCVYALGEAFSKESIDKTLKRIAKRENMTTEQYLEDIGLSNKMELQCPSMIFGGLFYTDSIDNLQEGTP